MPCQGIRVFYQAARPGIVAKVAHGAFTQLLYDVLNTELM
jgi:hypothetical protein